MVCYFLLESKRKVDEMREDHVEKRNASAEGTQRFVSRMRQEFSTYNQTSYRYLNGTDLMVSKVGYGSYRVDQQVDEHIESLEDSISSGCNIIDTSSNYTNGASEILIGNVLTKMMNQGKIERDEIILVSKTGYIQGDNLSQAIKREKTDQPWPEIVKYTDGCWHCIHPDFLIDQWDRSANRLQVGTIDVYLLHNPEYFFSEAKKSGAPESLPQLRDEFYQRIFQAFVQMERFVQEKKILFFGVSANTFVAPKHDFEHVSLSRVHTEALKAAETVHGDPHISHFKVVQLPYNFLETGALLEKNNQFEDDMLTVLEMAAAINVGVLVNRPLNAITEDRLYRLAKYPYEPQFDYTAQVRASIEILSEQEKTLRTQLRSTGNLDDLDERDQDPFFGMGAILDNIIDQIEGRDHWLQVAQRYLIPRVNHWIENTTQKLSDVQQKKLIDQVNQYARDIEKILFNITMKFNQSDFQRTQPIEDRLDLHLSEHEKKLTMSQKALNFVSSSPSVSVVLNGMRRPEYVDDTMGIMKVSDFGAPVQKMI